MLFQVWLNSIFQMNEVKQPHSKYRITWTWTKLENVCITLYSTHTSRRGSGSTRPTPSSDSCCTLGVAVQVHVMAATQTVNQLLPLIIISIANLYAYTIQSQNIALYIVTLRMFQLNQYKCFMEVTLTHDSVHIKRPIEGGTLHPSVTTNHCPRVLKSHKNKCVQNKCNTCCIEHS